MSRDLTYLKQIVEAINKIEHYTAEGRNVFYDTELIQDAVIRNIEVIGEVAKRVSDEFKKDCPTIPWRQMVGIRDVLIHDYDSIDMSIVWNVVSSELPQIKEILDV